MLDNMADSPTPSETESKKTMVSLEFVSYMYMLQSVMQCLQLITVGMHSLLLVGQLVNVENDT